MNCFKEALDEMIGWFTSKDAIFFLVSILLTVIGVVLLVAFLITFIWILHGIFTSPPLIAMLLGIVFALVLVYLCLVLIKCTSKYWSTFKEKPLVVQYLDWNRTNW